MHFAYNYMHYSDKGKTSLLSTEIINRYSDYKDYLTTEDTENTEQN